MLRSLFLGIFVASNWAVGTFLVVSVGTWYVHFFSIIIAPF